MGGCSQSWRYRPGTAPAADSSFNQAGLIERLITITKIATTNVRINAVMTSRRSNRLLWLATCSAAARPWAHSPPHP